MVEPIRLVVWDLDETFWKGTVTEGGIREYVRAHHDAVIKLARRGIMSSICSKNDSTTILSILEQNGILDYFIFPSISWESKGARLAQLVETVQLRAPTIMFIDDNANNRAEAAAMVPGLQVEDENFIPRMLADPRFQGKDDGELTRLRQYKLLEQRKRDEAHAAGGNEDFLRGCDIRVCIEHDVEAHLDRVIELVNRTNQLNYTKRRLPEDAEAARREFRNQMKPFDRIAGLVRVADKYGDYGFVGFFMTGGMRQSFEEGAANRHLTHFCFSCRTLGMLIEQWVYEYLGRPELRVVGEVLTDLSVPRAIDWVRLVTSLDDAASRPAAIAPQIVLYGGCEAQVLGMYLQFYADRLEVHGNYVANDIFVNVNYAARLVDICDRNPATVAAEIEKLGLPLHLETGDLFATATPGTLFVFNFSADANGIVRMRHRVHGWNFVLSPNGARGGVVLPAPDAELAESFDPAKTSYTAEQRDHVLRVNRHLREHYEKADKPDVVDLVEDMRGLVARIPTGAKLILIVDHDEFRPSAAPHEVRPLPWVARYRSVMEELMAEFPYAALISFSDVLKGPDEIVGANHYAREVYLRLAERIAEVAATLQPRSDAPLPKYQLAKLAVTQRVQRRWEAEARDLVHAGYECLMRRQPDPKSGEYFINLLANGRLSSAEFVRAIARTDEFKAKWVVPGARAPSRTQSIDDRLLRVPDDLALYPTHPKRVIIVGSCLSQGWAHQMKGLPQPCESDLYLLGHDLPEQPERPFSDYDFQIVQLALRFVLPDAAFARLAQSDGEGHKTLFAHALNAMKRLLDGAMRWNRQHGILTFVFPFIVPVQSPLGRLLPRYDLRNPVFFIEKLNESLARELENYSNVYFFDLNEIQAFYGKRYVQEDYYSAMNHGGYLSDFDFSHDANRLEPASKATDLFEERVVQVFGAAWRELVSLYRSIRQADAVKLVVIDLDDTLWRGVVAELDPDAMPTTEGWPKGFWEALLFLKRRGILLAIISKNEESRVLEVWDRIVGRDLKLDDFAMRRINWRPKPENMSEILAHVNLLPSNVVYIDDNPAERAAMKGAFPDIRVLGGTPLTWRRILLWSSETQVPTITAESAARTDMVRAQVAREEQRQTMSREEFLASLNVTMTLFQVEDANHPRFARVLELINKTNQFNTTGRRWTREECVAAFASGVAFHAFEVADLYTEYGLVGVLIVDSAGIRQFVMSCRIMGLEAEIAAVSRIGAILHDGGATAMFAVMVETERNQPCRNLYSRCGFEATEGGWRRSLDPWFPVPGHIALTVATTRAEPMLAAAE